MQATAVLALRRGASASLGLALCLLAARPFRAAPQANGTSSDLARQNYERVAASPAALRGVLGQDSGLMVALKQLVAKQASDAGQIVSDGDLADEAILERLDADIAFRAAATRLLQRYGYLLPRTNPESDAGKENQLVMVEKSKLLAQHQVEALTHTAEQGGPNRDSLKTSSLPCPNERGLPCQSPDAKSNPRKLSREDGSATEPGIEAEPRENVYPGFPAASDDSLLRAQARDWNGGASGSPPIETADGPRVPLTNVSVNRQGTADPEKNSSLAGSFMEGFSPLLVPGMKSRSDGLLGSYGGEDRSEFAGEREDVRGEILGVPSAPEFAAAPTMNAEEMARPRPAAIVRKTTPYAWVPSLYDMYVQSVPHPEEPRRFGEEVFENGVRNAQTFPMDLPAGPDYVVGPGDGLSINLWGGVSQRFYRVIDREGRVSLPEAGPVLVSGKTLAAIQQDLQKVLRTQFRDVSADVSLARLRTIRVYEVGDVERPGAYDISSLSTPLNALFSAGGPTPGGSLRIVNHYRGSQLVQTVDIYDLLLHGVKSNLERLENGDSVQVPPIGPRVTIEGMVRRPAIYELKDEKSLADVLELAGGILPAATLRHIEVQRIEAHQKQTMLSVDVRETDAAGEAAKKLEAFAIQDGDRIRIFPIAPYNEDAVYLEGHVLRPGRYSYRAGMRVTDLVGSYKDLLPEPAAQYAEIIRLRAPDFHPAVEGFDLASALRNPSQAPALEAMDTIRIFSRFDFENPSAVSVLGEVRAPGTFQTSGAVHLADAVHLAGGLAPDAETADAQVFRYLPDGKLRIFSVSLGEALAGNPAENILLEPRDRLLIHSAPEAAEPPSVYARGEVAKPGRYPLTTNMRVADLLRVAGGLKASADSETADLTRYDWSNPSKLAGQHEIVALRAALAGESGANAALKNGDTLTVRELPGWEDLGAAITLKGEVKHAGTYGIRPGERLSSVLERAGGFSPGAYPFGAILERVQVREAELKSRDEMMLRVKSAEDNLQLLPDSDPKQKLAKEAALAQWQLAMAALAANLPVGRVTIRISSQVERWKNTSADIEVRAGDVLLIPKRPSSVMVTGEVFNATAVSYRPGKNAKWYLAQSGGSTSQANKKAIFVIRANGSVLGARNGLFSGDSLSAALQPGDTVVVPEKALGPGLQWSNLLLTAQAASSIASTVFIALHY